jgi:hypothetical protein
LPGGTLLDGLNAIVTAHLDSAWFGGVAMRVAPGAVNPEYSALLVRLQTFDGSSPSAGIDLSTLRR